MSSVPPAVRTLGVVACMHSVLISERAGSFCPVSKQQTDNWQAALLDVWWNKCILICALGCEKHIYSQTAQKHYVGGFFLFLLCFSSLSPDRLILLLLLRQRLVVVSLHSTTLQSHRAQSNNYHTHLLYCPKSWELINSALYIFRAPYPDRRYLHTWCF